MKAAYTYKTLEPEDFNKAIALGNFVHGDGYLTEENITLWHSLGVKDGINSSFAAYEQNKLIGFRITFSAQSWSLDQWCSPMLWQVDANKVCYFKCNTVDENYRGQGVGSKLLKRSIEAAKMQGATAGVSHLWKQSPGNSAVKYFSKCGGILIKEHVDRWYQLSQQGYNCVLCGNNCHCQAAEMIIHF